MEKIALILDADDTLWENNVFYAVGIGAIHIPYHRPWSFEEVPVADPERVITLNRFADLLQIFPDSEEKS